MSSSSLQSLASDGTAGSSNLTLKMLPADKCPRCRVQFDFFKRVNITKVPLILNCKHTVCEDCIRRMCLLNNVLCPICKEKFTVLRSEIDSLPKIFQPHYTLMGQLVWAKNNSPKKEMNWVSTGQTLNNKNSGEVIDLISDDDESVEEVCEDFSNKELYFVFNKCIEHVGEYLNIHCDECDNTCCCYCFIENHVGHKATYLYKLNKEEQTQLEQLEKDLHIIYSQLQASKKQVKNIKSFDVSDVEQDIKNFFTDLHAKLHLAERNIRKKLVNVETEEVDVDTINSTLKSGLCRIKNILNHFALINSKQINVRALFDEIQELRKMPCKLVSDRGATKPLEFLADNVFDNIEDRIFLKNAPSLEFNLAPIEDWSQAYDNFGEMKMRRKSENSIETISEGSNYSYKLLENKPRRNNEGPIRVVVTHINNLHSFFVQKYNLINNLKDMNTQIGRRRRRRTENDQFKTGGIYGVLFATKHATHWRRGKLMEIIKSAENNYQYKMYFLDYGNTTLTTRDKMRELDIHTIKRPPFAFECKLTNPDQVDYDHNAHLHLPQIIGQKEVYIRFINPPNRNNVQEVDLLVATSNGGLISVHDLLTNSSSPMLAPKRAVLSSELMLFKNSKIFSTGQEDLVVVVYVKDPHYICVQSIHNKKIIEKMKSEMQDYYRNQPILSSIPVIGTDVVVKYEDKIHGNWHRAKITSVDICSKETDVFFVDWGKTAVVSWSDLRLLTESFIKVESQGIIVRLAHVEKLNPDQPWTELASEFLREHLINSNKDCKMLISQVEPLEVALFQITPSADICINGLLVEHKLAISSGSLSETSFWPTLVESTSEEDTDFSFQMIKKSEEVLLESEEELESAGLKLQVEVINFKNPDLIYIKFVKYKDLEEERQKELQIHYSSTKRKTKNVWKSGEICVILDTDSNNYFRGVIKGFTNKDDYLVYLYDYAREINLNKNLIFIQDAYFYGKPCHVSKCRLSNIKPAGDAGKWSQLAIEMLEKIFATYKTIHIMKTETNRDEKMIGVMMWYCITTPSKALEPSKQKFISINKSLVESGVAFFVSSVKTNTIPESVFGGKSQPKKAKKENWYDLVCEAENNDNFQMYVEDDEEELHATVQDSWPRSFKLQEREFEAALICVDKDGFFLIRNEHVQSLYHDLEENLNATFQSTPLKDVATCTQWHANDMCTIRYDNKWYRGTVLLVVNDDEITVEMIDFGSVHVVTKNDLSKGIMFIEIPPLVNKVRLYDVYSTKGEWTTNDVNDLLSVVTETVKVHIKGDLKLDIPYAEVYTNNGRSINDLFTTMCPHMFRRENKVVLESPDVIMIDSEPDHKSYTYIPMSDSWDEKQKMSIINILKLENIYKVVLTSTNVGISKQFKTLNKLIQSKANQQTELKNIKIDNPCICFHPMKKIWCRALVYNTDSLKYGHVLAFFVDYGTLEMIHVTKLKEINFEWLHLPVSMQVATINIELLQLNQAEYVMMQLSQYRGREVYVDVVSESPLKVHLYNDQENLCYQNLIDCGIIKMM